MVVYRFDKCYCLARWTRALVRVVGGIGFLDRSATSVDIVFFIVTIIVLVTLIILSALVTADVVVVLINTGIVLRLSLPLLLCSSGHALQW